MFSNIDFLKTILDTIEEGVLVSDSQGIIVAHNRQATEIMNLRGDEIMGKDLARPNWQQLRATGEPLPFEELPTTVTRRTGKPLKNMVMGLRMHENYIKWISVNTQILEHESNVYVFSTFIDITEQHKLLEEIKLTKERFKYALYGSDLGVWDLDAETGKLYFSDDWKSILGYDSTDLESVFEQWELLINPEDKDGVLKRVSDYISGVIPEYKIEYRLRCKNGDYKWVYSTGKIITRTASGGPKRFSGTIKDVTERKRIEELLRSKEEQFSSAFQYSAIGMALTSLEGNWIDVNPALCNLLGYSKEEMLQLTFQQITHPDDLPADLENVSKMLCHEINSYNMEKRFFHKNGSIIWVLLTVSMVWNKDNTPKFFIAQILDITPGKTLITELESKNAQLKLTTLDLSNKIEQLEEFNRIVAHNLRGPVGNIIQLGDMLAEDKTSADLYISMLKEASQGLDSTLKELIKILEIKLNRTVEYQVCSFEEMVSKVLSMLNIQMQDVSFVADFEVAEISYPAIYLESILYNLINNAVKYRNTTLKPQVNVKTYMEADRIVLEVSDNGIGIDLKKYGHQIFKLNKVFHKGYDSKGLGLFISKNQIETLGGTISVDSSPNNGSTFKIIF